MQGRMSWDLIVFDCDGVLVDSERVANRTLARELTVAGWAMDMHESIRIFMGRSEASCRAIIDAHFGRPMPQVFEAYYADLWPAFEAELEAIAGVADALAAIDARGWRTCVASSGSHQKMRRTLGRTGLWPRFEGRIFSAGEVQHGKPAPDLFLHAAARMGVDPRRAALVEDSAPGVTGGVAAGMTVFGFADLTAPATLAAAGAHAFAAMSELPALLDAHAPGRTLA
jgi:HAD superfamily hydrolase (TIGR01509 family)